MGIGGAPKASITAAAMRCLNATKFKQKSFSIPNVWVLIIESSSAREVMERPCNQWASKTLIKSTTNDLAQANVLFRGNGVTDGASLRGVDFSARANARIRW
jgi:fructose-1,6-bisphosphatase/sedoheptulose 1,7-bisphosphatase-like protein